MKNRIPNLNDFVCEGTKVYPREQYSNEAYEFVKDVLKLGSRDNLFDKFMKKKQIPSDDLADFMAQVISEIQYLYL